MSSNWISITVTDGTVACSFVCLDLNDFALKASRVDFLKSAINLHKDHVFQFGIMMHFNLKKSWNECRKIKNIFFSFIRNKITFNLTFYSESNSEWKLIMIERWKYVISVPRQSDSTIHLTANCFGKMMFATKTRIVWKIICILKRQMAITMPKQLFRQPKPTGCNFRLKIFESPVKIIKLHWSGWLST